MLTDVANCIMPVKELSVYPVINKFNVLYDSMILAVAIIVIEQP
jgi:hypothetical protein